MNSITEYDKYVISFLSYLKKHKQSSENTLSAYSLDLEQWRSFLVKKKLNWSQVVKQDIVIFLFQLSSKKNNTKRTQSRKLSAIKHFYNYCLEKEYIEKNNFANFSAPKYQKTLPKAISPINMSILLEDKTKQTPFIQVRDIFLLEFLYSTGCRISEALKLDFYHVFDGEDLLEDFIIQGKGGKERVVFLTTLVKEVFFSYFKMRKKQFSKENILDAPLFINLKGSRLTRRGANYVLQMRKKNLNIQSTLSAHSLRHSFATDILNEGADIRKVQELLGHASVSTTQNYTHIAKERLFEIFRNSHPHAKK